MTYGFKEIPMGCSIQSKNLSNRGIPRVENHFSLFPKKIPQH